MSLALSGDLVVAAASVKFNMAYSKIAASPDGSSTYFLPRLIGLRNHTSAPGKGDSPERNVLTAARAMSAPHAQQVAIAHSTIQRSGGRRSQSGSVSMWTR